MHKINIVKTSMLFMFFIGIISINSYDSASATSSISISAPAAIDLDLSPTNDGTYNYTTADFVVATSQTSGVRVLLNGDSTDSLTNQLHPNQVISSIITSSLLKDFPHNSWGIYLGTTPPDKNTTFAPVSTIPTEFYQKDGADMIDTFKLAIGASVNTELPAGTYTNEIVISVVATPKKDLSSITTMQEMNFEICNNTGVNDSKRLIDIRDNKTYWVGKTADEHCWMQQNLDLELAVDNGNAVALMPDGKKILLTNDNTDLSTSVWSSSTGLAPSATLKVAPSTSYQNNNGTYSWDAGEVIITNPTASKQCGSGPDFVTAGVSLATLPTTCPQYFKNVKNLNDNYVATPTSSYDSSSNSYDSHYLIGDYYTYGAATAGTANKVASSGQDAPDSICPSGWRLPTANEQATLLAKYDVTSSAQGLINASIKPLYGIRCGGAHPTYGSLRSAGDFGDYWSSTAASSSNAYAYRFSVTYTNVSIRASAARYLGFSVRCIAVDAD